MREKTTARNFFKFIIIYFFLGIIGIVNASTKDHLVLNRLLKNIHTLEGDFIQHVYNHQNKLVHTSYGHIALAQPQCFRWEVTKPLKQLIIANHTKLWIYDPDLEEVTIRAFNQTIEDAPAFLFLQGQEDISKNFIVHRHDQNNMDWFNLTPKKENSLFTAIQLGFVNHQLSHMNLEDHLGQRTEIYFQRLKQNKSVSKELFILHIPAHVDVIDETRQL